MSDTSDIPTSENETGAPKRYLSSLKDIPWTAATLLLLGGLATIVWAGVLGWFLILRLLGPALGLAIH
jgi:hypothetical protein